MTRELREKMLKAKAISENEKPKIELIKFIPDTRGNKRVRDEKLRMNYDYAHAVLIGGIQRATWMKRPLSVGWRLIDIDGDEIKAPGVNTYRDRATGGMKERHFTASVNIGNIEQAMQVTADMLAKNLIPTPKEMKKRRAEKMATTNRRRRAQWKMDRAEAIRDQAIEMHNTLSNIVAMDAGSGASCRGLAQAALNKVKLPPEPNYKEAPGDPPGTWLVSADRLYPMKGKRK